MQFAIFNFNNLKKRRAMMSEYINKIRYNAEVAEDFFSERIAFTLGPVELKKMMEDEKVKVIDVRAKEDYDEGHIPEAISVPKKELPEELMSMSKEDLHVVYCYNQQCHLAAAAALILAKNGYPVMELEGGFNVWKNYFKFEVVK